LVTVTVSVVVMGSLLVCAGPTVYVSPPTATGRLCVSDSDAGWPSAVPSTVASTATNASTLPGASPSDA